MSEKMLRYLEYFSKFIFCYIKPKYYAKFSHANRCYYKPKYYNIKGNSFTAQAVLLGCNCSKAKVKYAAHAAKLKRKISLYITTHRSCN